MDLTIRNRINKLNIISQIYGIIIILFSLIILIGWTLNIKILITPSPNYAPTALTTSISFIFIGISIILLKKRKNNLLNKKITQILSFIIIIISILTLLDYTISYMAGTGFIQSIVGIQNVTNYKIPLVSSISLLLTGIALLTIDNKPYGKFDISHVLMGIVGLLFYLILLGFIYQSRIIDIPSTTAPSVYGTIIFILIVLGVIFSRPDKGITEILISERVSGAFGRTLIPAVILLPLIIGGIRILGENAGLYDTNFGVAIMAFSTTVILFLIILRSIKSLDHLEVLRLKAEANLRESAAEIEDLYNNAPCGYHSLDENGDFIRVNNTELSWLGYSREEIIGKNFKDLISKNSQKIFKNNYSRFMERGYVNDLEFEMIKKDGAMLPIILNATAVKDPEGNFISSRSTLFDITELKQSEKAREKLIKDLERSNEDLKSFAYIASHDLQEPLRTISNYAQLLRRRYEDKLDEDADDFINYMVDGAGRMQNLIKGLLEYSRVDTQGNPFHDFETTNALKNALDNLESSIEESSAEISYNSLPVISGDFNQISRVFQNIIGNAIKYSKKDEIPKINVKTKKEDNSYIFLISDNSIGMKKEDMDKIFEPFRRLHGVGEYSGSGIGLAIVKRIIERHGGNIWVESELDKGSTFYFTIPTAKNQ
ncbi:sensor histidine kinase [Methanobacterium sp.]|uniref:sensor histidine kinase n=1 Tax=Methanobacterium sp. TaxID=2164 RepID=UPI003C785C66